MKSFRDFVRDNLPKIEGFDQNYKEAIHYILDSNAKYFRPSLLLSVVKAYEPLLIENSYDIAFGLECFHTYSLIHDDLPCMDNSSLRRGKETLHIKYNELTAVLVGDALNTYAFELISKSFLSDEVKIRLIQELSINGGLNGMVLGQIIDCNFQNKVLNIDEVKFLHINKTAKLIASSLKMGAIISQRKVMEEKILYDFGLKLGLLFQIQDDILDLISNQENSGKPILNDVNKNSFINVIGYENSINEANNLVLEIQNELSSFNDSLKNELEALLLVYLNRHKEV